MANQCANKQVTSPFSDIQSGVIAGAAAMPGNTNLLPGTEIYFLRLNLIRYSAAGIDPVTLA